MKILLVGDYPPPYGGVSVQIQTLQQHLRVEHGWECVVLNVGTSRRDPIDGCLSTPNAWVFVATLLSHARKGYFLHIITNGHNWKSWACALAGGIAGLLNYRRSIIALDSGAMPDYVNSSSWLMRQVIKLTLGASGAVVCRNQRARQTLQTFSGLHKRVEVIAAYSKGVICEMLPSSVDEFLRSHSPVIGTIVAFRPEYGLELLLQSVRTLVKDHPRLGLIVVGSGGEPSQAYTKLLHENGRVLCLRDLSHPVCLAVISRLDVFARCTYYDGDAISVREALGLGVPVVASDTDSRPEGAILFHRGDVQDLTQALSLAIRQNGTLRESLGSVEYEDSVTRITTLYRDLADECG